MCSSLIKGLRLTIFLPPNFQHGPSHPSPLLTASVSAQLETLLSHLLELIQFVGGDERQIVIFINGGVSRVLPPSCCCCLWLFLWDSFKAFVATDFSLALVANSDLSLFLFLQQHLTAPWRALTTRRVACARPSPWRLSWKWDKVSIS